jgi:hypothetical protein
MARARGRDSHAEGRMLDYSIRGPLAPSIATGFYGWIGKGRCRLTPVPGAKKGQPGAGSSRLRMVRGRV